MIITMDANFFMLMRIACITLLFVALLLKTKELEKMAKQHQQLLKMSQELFGLSQSNIDHLIEQTTQHNTRLEVCEKHFKDISSEQETLAHQYRCNTGYQQATRMIELGAGVEDLMKDSNISRAEAELLVSLHAYQGAASKKLVHQ